MHWKLSISLFTFWLCPMLLQGQNTISGMIQSESGEALPFATVYVEGSTNGTTSNADGRYQLTFDAGPATIVAQYIGYARQTQTIDLPPGEHATINFELAPETLVLKEVVISASEKDPARQVIRNAIRKRKYYADEVSAYTCEVYIKGLQRLDKKPNSLLGMTVIIDTGIVYLSESISKLKYLHPDKVNETMISSKVSGNNNAFSYNQASEMRINLYENSFFIEGLSERSFISPIANNAFLYYDYQMAGTIVENGLFINKIKIIPKRKTDPVFSGYLYIIEDSWRIHSVDVKLTKDNGIEFLDSLSFNQVFAPVDYDIWMPISQRFTFKFRAFGFKGSGHFTAIYRNYQVEPNYWQPRAKDPKTVTEIPKKVAKKSQKEPAKETLLSKEDFSNAVVTVVDGANEKDSLYWASVRPIPLTEIEVRDYQIKDSIGVIRKSKPYKDSIDQVRNKFKPGNLFFNGYTHFNSYNRRYFSFPTLVEGLQYNSVEGLVTNLEFSFQKRTEQSFDYTIKPGLRYGFANKKLQAKVEVTKMINLKKRLILTGGLGRYVFQMNEQEPITPFSNSFFTLVRGENHMRLFQKYFTYFGYQKELTNGVLLNGKLSYEQRETLQNTASYNVFDKTFHPNTPVNQELAATDFPKHQTLTAAFRLRIRFAQQYIERPDRKIILSSEYPDVYVFYKKGINLLGGDTNYDLVKVGSEYSLRVGQVGTSKISAQTGLFLNTRRMYFPDFHHFNGNLTYIRQAESENQFQLLDYYPYSTQDRFLQAHYEHHFNEFIFNKIPGVRRLNLQAVGSVNYLTTPVLGHYFEFGAGIEHILKFFRVDFYTSVTNGQHSRAGIRFGAGF